MSLIRYSWKAPNQLGTYDMSGNVWEWCQDSYVEDVAQIPADGAPYLGDSTERVLRGGCFHNWAIHCAVARRYQIDRAIRQYLDELNARRQAAPRKPRRKRQDRD